jgi:hypothetical protein
VFFYMLQPLLMLPQWNLGLPIGGAHPSQLQVQN